MSEWMDEFVKHCGPFMKSLDDLGGWLDNHHPEGVDLEDTTLFLQALNAIGEVVMGYTKILVDCMEDGDADE